MKKYTYEVVVAKTSVRMRISKLIAATFLIFFLIGRSPLTQVDPKITVVLLKIEDSEKLGGQNAAVVLQRYYNSSMVFQTASKKFHFILMNMCVSICFCFELQLKLKK